MSNILAIETTLGTCSVALSSGETRYVDEPNQQTSQLATMVDEVMQEANTSYTELKAYAVTIGPGSFTGVRIGLAFVRGLALAVNKPIYAINTLELLAYQAIEAGADGQIVSAINAHRNQIYIQNFMAKDWLAEAISQAEAIDVEAVPSGKFTLAGNAEQFFSNHNSITKTPDAAALARFCEKLPIPNVNDKPAPLYLRPADAKPQKINLTIAQ